MSENLKELLSIIHIKFPDLIVGFEIRNGELTVCTRLETLVRFIDHLSSDSECQFTTLIDITAIDYPHRAERFTIVYHFLSMVQNLRIRVKVDMSDGEIVPSIVSLHSSANWFEREVFDMYGIYFSGHPDLRRILTDYGFTGYPLRKDFPTTGYSQVRYDESKKQVVYEPTKLSQEYRQFDFLSPWEGDKIVDDRIEDDTNGKN